MEFSPEKKDLAKAQIQWVEVGDWQLANMIRLFIAERGEKEPVQKVAMSSAVFLVSQFYERKSQKNLTCTRK